MLFPVGIVHPDAVSFFVILLLQGVEELVYQMLFRPESEVPAHRGHHDDNHNGCDNPRPPFARTRRVIGLSFEQGHGNSQFTSSRGILRERTGRTGMSVVLWLALSQQMDLLARSFCRQATLAWMGDAQSYLKGRSFSCAAQPPSIHCHPEREPRDPYRQLETRER